MGDAGVTVPSVDAAASGTVEVEGKPTSLPEMGAVVELASPGQTPTSAGKKRGSKIFKLGRLLTGKRLVSLLWVGVVPVLFVGAAFLVWVLSTVIVGSFAQW